MGIRDASSKEKIVIYFNALVRLAQFIVAAAAIGVYANQKGYWLDHGIPSRITYELVVGSLALVTAFCFAIIPFVLSYRPVAIGSVWDLILMILWAAAFGLMKAIFLRSYQDSDDRFEISDPTSNKARFRDHWNDMVSAAYINLAGLILFLISGIMGLVLFFIGRRSSGSRKL